MKKHIQILAAIPLTFGSLLGADNPSSFVSPFVGNYLVVQREMSLDTRYGNKFVNDVFRDNILLNLAYLKGQVSSSKDINWDQITQP